MASIQQRTCKGWYREQECWNWCHDQMGENAHDATVLLETWKQSRQLLEGAKNDLSIVIRFHGSLFWDNTRINL